MADTTASTSWTTVVLRGTVSIAFAALALSSSTVPVDAQTVQGRLIDAQRDRPVGNALVRLTDGAGESLFATATDSAGHYQFALPGLGRYRVRGEQVGYKTQTSAPFRVRHESDVFSIDVRLEPNAVPGRPLEATADQVDRRLSQFLGVSPVRLRIRPIRSPTIRDHVSRGHGLPEMIGALQFPNLLVLRSREGPCYQFRGRGCFPVYLDGTRLIRGATDDLALALVSTVVILLPAEAVAYPEGAIHLFSVGYMP